MMSIFSRLSRPMANTVQRAYHSSPLNRAAAMTAEMKPLPQSRKRPGNHPHAAKGAKVEPNYALNVLAGICVVGMGSHTWSILHRQGQFERKQTRKLMDPEAVKKEETAALQKSFSTGYQRGRYQDELRQKAARQEIIG